MTDTATAVAAAPFVAALQPYLTAAATAFVGGAVTLAAGAIRKWTGLRVSQANVDAIRAAAQDEAGKAVAAAADNLATAKIDVGSPIVSAAADAIAARLPDVLKSSGVSPGDLDHIIAGEIGRLQASMTAVYPPATPKAS
ncbi:MAG TPA: hypothetical protein VFE63_22090 [Roseiarcus sp.]|jgi:hypothetical protein|nr:hypothetical protein [Roseiarcus sp.]